MTIDDLLYGLGGTEPTDVHPTPGFSPATRKRGEAWLNQYTPQTPTERALVDAARPLFGQYTPEQHRAFRVALRDAYLGLDYTQAELGTYFRDLA